MALAPADFYAYSRATGVPVPENPEERAALTPEVLEFRRNQLRAPQQESNPLAALGAAALGIGALAGGIAAVKGFGRSKPAVMPKGSFEDVKAVDAYAKQRAAEQATRQAREERPQGIVQTDLSRSVMPTEAEAMQSYSAQLSQMFPEPTASEMEALGAPSRTEKILARLGTQPQYRPDPKDINYARFGPVSKEVAEARRTQATEDLLRFAQQRQEDATLGATQTLGALESGEDQMTGRVMRGVLRNEDLDASQVNQVARQTGSAEVAASLTPDGVPVDQLELNQPYTAQELVGLAKQEMISRRQTLEQAGLRPGTVRFERALAQPFRTSQGTQVTGTGSIDLSLPAGPVRQTVASVEASEPLIERSVINVGPQAVVTSTAAGTAVRGASPSYHEALPKQELRQLYGSADVLVPGAPDELVPDLPASLRIRGGVAPDVEPELLSKQEIQYSVLDRPEVPVPPGGSAGIGIYGVEPGYVPGAMSKVTGEYSEAASRKPTYVPGWLQKKEGRTGFESLSSEQLATAAEKAQGPRIQSAIENELNKRNAAKQSMEVSEALRRARIEGRDPQALLRQRGFNV